MNLLRIGILYLLLQTGCVVNPQQLAAPSVNAIPHKGYVEVVWAPVTGADSYNVYKDFGQGYTKLINCKNLRVSDGRVTAAQSYSYEVAAVDGSGNEGQKSTPSVAKAQ